MALTEGTAALALTAYMTSTGIPLTVISGGAAAVDSVIVDFCAATGVEYAATAATLAGGCAISTAGAIILGVAAVAICAAIVVWLLKRNGKTYADTPEFTPQPTTVTSSLKTASGQNVPFASVETTTDINDLRLDMVPWLFFGYGATISWPGTSLVKTVTLHGRKITLSGDMFVAQPDLSGGSYAAPNYSYATIFDFASADGQMHYTQCIGFTRFRSSGNWFAGAYINGPVSPSGTDWYYRNTIQSDRGNSGGFNVIYSLAYVRDSGKFFLLGFTGGKNYSEDMGDLTNTGPGRSIDGFTATDLSATASLNAVEYQKQPAAESSTIRNPEYPAANPLDKRLEITLPPELNPVTNPDLDADSIVQAMPNYAPDLLPNTLIGADPQPNPNPDPQPVPVPEPAPVIDSEPVQIPTLPIVGSGDSGMIRLWNPTKTEMETLSNYLLSGDFIDNVLKLFRDPADYLLSLALMPVTPAVSANKMQPYIGNIAIPGLTMYAVTDQYADIDCGSVTIPAKYGTFVDFDTQVSIYVPYCGEMALNTSDVIGSTLSLRYRVDLLTGTCTAMLRVQRSANGIDLDAVLYQWQGNIAAQLPIRASTWSVGITDVAAGAIAGATAGPVGALVGGAAALGRGMVTPRISGSGSLTGNAGHLGVQTPYIIITTPRSATPSTYVEYSGRAEDEVVSLSTLSGYNQISDIHLEGISATRAELAEIDELLKGGVIF